ncbi:Sua5 family translation factor [Catenovulum agarivorans DS-2]|uniref:Threonylcarbamoyl-AMP synthase n=1 Tax=Catenovulum agarivorans DS-2 TaxID=1328313 RepID=W7QG86_9ALTE|nr:L-threonylcarbamoyladenylate synthase [Catenovulum agarivorans]EWH10936.1 Sua5 family translation factor [Catenovulum agarivorans DS-2]
MTDINNSTELEIVQQGGVIAYPTESCFGLGCDPNNQQAVLKILELKQRDINKGLILIASDYSQLLPFVDDAKIPQDKRYSAFSHWPGPYTLLLPAKSTTPKFLTGQFDTIAVRVTAHQGARDLCRRLGHALVSTSANLAGEESAKSAGEVARVFADQIDLIVAGEIGQSAKPSTIINPLTGEVFRA